MKLWIKIGAATLAFVPMALFFLDVFLMKEGVLSQNIGRDILIGCGIFDLPACSLSTLAESYQLSEPIILMVTIGSMLAWSSFIAWLFWRVAGTFLGEGEPEYETNPARAKFDWVGFQVRFVIGFILGFLAGWRLVGYSTNKTTVLIAMTITGLFCGLAFGLYRPNFLSR